MEKRNFSRVPFAMAATVKSLDGAQEIRGEIENISMAGMLIDCGDSWEDSQPVVLEIVLDEGGANIAFTLNGNIVRKVASGQVGIQFDLTDISLDSVSHLRKLVSYNLGDGDIVIDEFLRGSHKDN